MLDWIRADGSTEAITMIYDKEENSCMDLNWTRVCFLNCHLKENTRELWTVEDGISVKRPPKPHHYGFIANRDIKTPTVREQGVGIAFEFRQCELDAMLYGYYDYAGASMHNVDCAYSDCQFNFSAIWQGLMHGDLVFTDNLVTEFTMGYRFQFCDDQAVSGSQKDAANGPVDVYIANNWFTNAAPGNQLFEINRAHNLTYEKCYYGVDHRTLMVDYKLEGGSIAKENVDEFTYANEFIFDITKGGNDQILVHGHEVKFVYSEEVDDPEANVVTNYSPNGDAPVDKLL